MQDGALQSPASHDILFSAFPNHPQILFLKDKNNFKCLKYNRSKILKTQGN